MLWSLSAPATSYRRVDHFFVTHDRHSLSPKSEASKSRSSLRVCWIMDYPILSHMIPKIWDRFAHVTVAAISPWRRRCIWTGARSVTCAPWNCRCTMSCPGAARAAGATTNASCWVWWTLAHPNGTAVACCWWPESWWTVAVWIDVVNCGPSWRRSMSSPTPGAVRCTKGADRCNQKCADIENWENQWSTRNWFLWGNYLGPRQKPEAVVNKISISHKVGFLRWFCPYFEGVVLKKFTTGWRLATKDIQIWKAGSFWRSWSWDVNLGKSLVHSLMFGLLGTVYIPIDELCVGFAWLSIDFVTQIEYIECFSS